MKLGKLQLSNSIFSRLVITFLLIMIPIYILGIYIYNWSLRTVKSEISKSTIAQVSFYLEGLEKEVGRIKILQYDCLNDENLNKLAVRWEIMDQYQITECIRQLQQKLVTIKNSSIYIKNVSVHILPIDRTISSKNGLEEMEKERFDHIRVPSGDSGAQIVRYKGGLYLTTLHMDNNTFDPTLMIEIELDQDTLRQALSQYNTYNGSGSLLLSRIGSEVSIFRSDSGNPLSAAIFKPYLEKAGSNGMEYTRTDSKGFYIVYAKSDYLGMVLLKYIPEEYIIKPLHNFTIWVWVFTLVAAFLILIYSFSTYKFMHKPLLELVKSFQKVEQGDLQVYINHDSKNEFGYLYKRFNDMVKNLNMLIDQAYNQKILMQRAELKHLQSQINPHFLYNSLFMINTMARIGDENLIPFSRHLGEYFRFVTRNSSDDIPLKEEIAHAKVYTEIQYMRFSKRVRVQFGECPEQYRNISVPRLILQPLIENAFAHGIEKKKSDGIISIQFEGGENELSIIVEDNGNDITDPGLAELQGALERNGEAVETTGVINIHRRIVLTFGEGSGLQVARSELGGLKVRMKLILPGGNGHVPIADC